MVIKNIKKASVIAFITIMIMIIGLLAVYENVSDSIDGTCAPMPVKVGYTADAQTNTIEYVPPAPPPREYLGQFNISYYTTGDAGVGTTTASGKTVAPGMIAMSSAYPIGTKVEINGTVYTVEDRGGAIQGNHIDIFVPTNAEAIARGRHMSDVYRINE
ncbi:MAG: 3D domain-containing protein [Clostridiales Family XIII bacterium]|jgi:3D (Asp-Asp-Asp) domain-containing protein|nr:3D domain-containing protein [Clostridiales Family XIII bacterium]